MLKQLHIRNLAIVENLELDFGPGMTVLTGETGAGKSILLDALGLTLGDRADSALVRHGAKRAEVTAGFATEGLDNVAAWLEENELEAEGECLIRRTVNAEGRSRAYINGQPVPIQLLKALGEQLVDIHGQHAHQSLMKRDAQRRLLDDYAGHGKQLTALAETFRRWTSLREEYEQLSRVAEERDARLELLRYQVQELTALELQPGELEELDSEHQRLAHANRLLEGCQRAVAGLYEDEGAITGHLDRLVQELQELQRYDAGLATTTEMLETAAIQAKEAATELRHYVSGLELDPERLEQVEQRLGDIHDLARKHRTEPEELPDLLARLEQELESLEGAGARLEGMAEEIEAARREYLDQAGKLSQSRRKAAKALGKRVTDQIHGLGMGEGQFEIGVEKLTEEEAGPTGLDRIELRVAANPGQPMRALSKVASGGELSRISLAIQVCTAGQEGIPTLIFDEVDVGIGGAVAEMVGRLLRQLAGERQILCVTHQAQVAALGHQHMQVSKQVSGKQTTTSITELGLDERVEEIARMLGGLEITEQTEAHARDLIGRATA
jgi:DNA repair protein RecN (Recombination protein N)